MSSILSRCCGAGKQFLRRDMLPCCLLTDRLEASLVGVRSNMVRYCTLSQLLWSHSKIGRGTCGAGSLHVVVVVTLELAGGLVPLLLWLAP